MSDEPTLEQEIEQAVEESVIEDAGEKKEEDTSTANFQSEGSTEEVLVPVEGETRKKAPEDTQEESEADTQDDAQSVAAEGDTQEEPEGDTEEPKSTHISPDTLAGAVGLGLTLEEARSFGSEAALSQFNARVSQDRNRAIQWQQAQQQAVQQEQQQEPVDPFADLPELDPENYDSEVVEMFDRLTNIVRGQHEEIQGFRGQQEQASIQVQEAGRREVESWFDTEVEGLGDSFEAQLGKGAYSSMDKNSQQAINRDAIADHMSIMISGYHHHGMAVPSRSKIFEFAAKAVLSDRYAELANEDFTRKLEKQSTQTIQRVNKSKVKRSLTPEEEDAELGALLDSTFS